MGGGDCAEIVVREAAVRDELPGRLIGECWRFSPEALHTILKVVQTLSPSAPYLKESTTSKQA